MSCTVSKLEEEAGVAEARRERGPGGGVGLGAGAGWAAASGTAKTGPRFTNQGCRGGLGGLPAAHVGHGELHRQLELDLAQRWRASP